ncbi:MAG: phosphoglycerate kinase [Gammaproteobacteria bacterium]|nr:phosphoglycerate kinase [Gammaproteobacteria bacterium]
MTTARFLTLADVDPRGKRVLVRVDFNVPLQDGRVADDTRIRATLPTIHQLRESGAAIILCSHLGRPKEGEPDPKYSLGPVADHLGKLLRQSVPLVVDWLNGVEVKPGQVVLLENVRFLKGEKGNDDDLARKMARLCDIYVNDAFATAHRAQASTHGIAKYAPTSCAGPLLVAEMEALGRVLEQPARPLVAVVGGAKVSTKLALLENLLRKVDKLIVGGGIANTFLKAAGFPIGGSLHEEGLLGKAAAILERANAQGKSIPMPVDLVCAAEISDGAKARVVQSDGVAAGDLIVDIGPRTVEAYRSLLAEAATIVWNGPVGVFEIEAFSAGTRAIAEGIAASRAFSIAGGGDTLAAVTRFGISDRISYLSTGGGAFLEFLEGQTLPAIAMLEESARATKAAEEEY